MLKETNKAISDHLDDTNNPHEVTKEQVGLGNANNTSDVDKPISTATQNALNNKTDESDFYDPHREYRNPS